MSDGYDFEKVMREARQRCIDKGEGWRWGVKDGSRYRGSENAKDTH
jgi:hypothetical protein